jgi:KDO2-lipid IV(A) lauroyltransferase
MNKKNMNKEVISNLISFENESVIEDAKKSNRPIIMITAHYGNWEIMNVGLAKLFEKTNVVYKKLNNPHFDKYLCETRERFHTNMIEKRGALRALSSALKNHEPLSLLVDQNTSPKDGIEIEFFNKVARQSAAPAQLARKYNALIIPVFVTTDDEENYLMSFKEPIEVAHSEDAQKDILDATQKQADVIASQIKKEPKFWFWCHRRWRTGNEKLY